MARARLGLSRIILVAVMVVGCRLSDAVGDAPSTPVPDTEATPEAVSHVVSADASVPIGIRLHLENGAALTVGPPGTQMIGQSPNRSADAIALYGHDHRGLWVVWLGRNENLGPDCYALSKIGYDRPGFIGWPDDGFKLPKAPGFRAESGVSLDRDPGSHLVGWWSSGGLAPQATFCISSGGAVTSVSP